MPCENTCIISAASASQYQKELETQKKFKSGKPLSSAESAFRMKALKVYGQTLAPKWQRKFEEKMADIEAKMAAEADRIIENENKNHSEAMGSMEEIKTMVKSAEASIIEGMQQKMQPLPNQVEMLGILLKKNTECLKAMCVQAGVCAKGNKFEKAQRLSAFGSENAWNC